MTKQVYKKTISVLAAFAVVCTGFGSMGRAGTAEAAKKASLRQKSISVTVGKTQKIVVKNRVKKAKYTFQSKKKKIATVSKTGKIKGLRVGKTTITVMEKTKKRKRKVGAVKVTVKSKKVSNKVNHNIAPPPAQSEIPAIVSAGPIDSSNKETAIPAVPSANPTSVPGGETEAPVPSIDSNDSTYGVTWHSLPIVEEFESESELMVKNSVEGKTTFQTEGGVENSGYVMIDRDQYNGPTIFFDNRLGTESKSFLCSAYIKAVSEDGMYCSVDMWGGNQYSDSAYISNMYDIPASRRLSDRWEQIVGVITVPAGKFREIRIKSDTADFCIDRVVAKELEESDNTTMEPNPEKPAPDDAITDTFTMSGDEITVDASSWGYAKNSEGSYVIEDEWRYILIPLSNFVDCSEFVGVTMKGSASTKYRISLFDEYKSNLMGNNQFIYANVGFEDKATMSFSVSGFAKYLYIGSCSSGEDLTLKLDSFTFNKKANTDGTTETIKEIGENNPIATQRFTADPYAIEYNGTVYVYGTNDSEQLVPDADGQYTENNYSKIKSLNCYSSKDMVNWTDEGTINVGGSDGAATWANNSWAPAVTYKEINGKTKFFIYFANSANNIGVLESDSPIGPWRDPIGKPLIDRNTPNCSTEEIGWLFDPAVLVDDDGQGYLYFGGIGDAEDRENPKCSRVVKLGDDMVSLKEDPVTIDAPGMFEDSGINKIGDKYYYSYCTNFSDCTTTKKYGNGTIVYMVSDNPMTGWQMGGAVLNNPGTFFPGVSGNNHHCMLERNGELYMFYHTMKMGNEMGLPSGYRTTSVDKITNTDGVLSSSMTMKGVEADATLNPYESVEAETFAWSVGTSTLVGPSQEGRNNRVLSSISSGDYVGLDSVAFGNDGAKSLTMCIANSVESGTIEVYIDSMESNNLIGELNVSKTEGSADFKDMSVDLTKTVTGTHRVFFVFKIKDIFVDSWSFHKMEIKDSVMQGEVQ